MALGEVDGEHYGLPTNINLKSMVWYPKDDFDAAGYEVPETWDDLIALSDQIVDDGGTPWCVGFQSEGSTGWPATDWMEDIMLRTAGPEVYDQWVSHEIPFDDPAVMAAGERFGEIMFGDGYVLGGAEATPNVPFGDAPAPLFDDPPGCWLHRQASFITAQPGWDPNAEAGVDYDWFPFPTIDQEGVLYAGELTVVGANAARPEVVEFLEALHLRRGAVRDGRCPGLVPDLPQRERRGRLLRERPPGGGVGGSDHSAGGGHRSLRRIGPHAGRGRERQLLDRHDRVRAERARLARRRARRHRGELALNDEDEGAVVVRRPLPHQGRRHRDG